MAARVATTLMLIVGAGCAGEESSATGAETPPVRAAAQETAPPIDADPASIASPLVEIPTLEYRPLFRGEDEPVAIALRAFDIEVHAVTNAQFRAFVGAVPQWRRSRVKALFADEAYLAQWRGDLEPPESGADRPVTNVSWFAARAYAAWIGRRLPSVAEWETVAAASETATYGREQPEFVQRILDWYGRPTPAIPAPVRSTFANVHGVYDMHGLIWEWVEDFNTALVTGESRGDTGLERNLFCGAGSIGAADPADYAAFMRFAFRSSVGARYAVKNLGFRCAADTDRE